jgi:hypothetical protein
MLSMSKPWRCSRSFEEETRESNSGSRCASPYVTARSAVVERQLTPSLVGGLHVRFDREGMSDLDELEANAIKRVFEDRTIDQMDVDPNMWMFAAAPLYMVDVRQDEQSFDAKLDQESIDDSDPGVSARSHQACKFLREDWLKDPSHLFGSFEQFSSLRSCSNVMSAVVFSMMNKIGVQMSNRIHKHARINNEILYRVQQNIEQTHSFTEVFMNNINKYMRQYMTFVERAEEEKILESTALHELAEDICKTRTLFAESTHDILQYCHRLVDALLPESML